MWRQLVAGLVFTAMTGASLGGEQSVLRLPPPQTEGGKPLMQALKLRQSAREFSPQALPPQLLSNLLWAAAGINRPQSGKRTAPSARDWQEIDIYVATAEAVYRYDARDHLLRTVVARDLRVLTGSQDFVAQAPVNLVYVADLNRMRDASADQKDFYAAADAGFIAENVYLFCASEGLAVVVRGSIDREAFAAALGLAPHQRVVLAQTVGYPPARR
jgi:SagB-type dehydrogenase family enzyme